MKTTSKELKTAVKKESSKFSLYDIAVAVERDSKGQMNVESRLATDDASVAYELIAVALYKSMRRRGVGHVQALKSTEDLIFTTDMKVAIGKG